MHETFLNHTVHAHMDRAVELIIKSLKDTEVGNTLARYVAGAEKLDPQCRKLVLKAALELAERYRAV